MGFDPEREEEMDNMIIRHVKVEDVAELARIEAASYPEAEAASEESIRSRVESFPECFWILENDGEILAFINGMVTDERDLRDEMYDHAEMHKKDGKWQMIFSVVTAPEHRSKGYAGMLMKQVIEDSKGKRDGIVLTCKDRLLGFYGQFGYENEGVSVSTHGGAVWYQMRLVF
ncbi:MAG: GNAT family N-acetyltransferase [Eubacteriaceae bacterium]|nr:GNAT family N-acetyltransferase [Eubacteriaceae bacterium]